MNKTVNINIGGLFFHIDDNAYTKLNNYLQAIKHSLAEDSKDEVMNDIELRISEIISARIQPDKQVVNILDIEYIISIMGQPEDYIIEDEGNKNYKNQTAFENVSYAKKLFRDESDGRIGGVCAGLGHYFGIDSIWIRILFLILFFSTAGTSLIIYLILWIVLPKATTTSEKLQMHGEPINISNIEKKIKENFDTEELGRKSRSAVSAIENFFKNFFFVVAKFFGVLLLFISIVSLGSILVFGGILILNSLSFINNIGHIDIPFQSTNLFWFALLLIITAGIPLFFLFLLSLKILNSKFKLLGRYSTFILLIIWFLSLLGWTAWGINQGTQEEFLGKKIEKVELNISPTDTLKVNAINNIFYSSEENPSYSGKIMLNENGDKILYSNRVELIFKETEEQPYVLTEKNAKDREIDAATKIAEQISYDVVINNNVINANNYYTSNNKNKNNKQAVKLYIYVPKNTVIKLNKEAQNFSNTYTPPNQNNLNSLFKFDENNQLNCINCSEKENTTDELIQKKSANQIEREVDSILNAAN